jgi:hypothetical protein
MVTVWAYSFDDKVRAMRLEALWQQQLRHVQVVEAEGLLTSLAKEVRVLILIMVIAVAVAQFIACAIATAFDGMHHVMVSEERQGTEHIRLINRLYPPFQFCQRERLDRLCQSLGHHDAVGCGFNAMRLEQRDDFRVHA